MSNLFGEYLEVLTEIPSESQLGWIQGFSAKPPDILGNQDIKKS